jgi:acetolactate decarboxylase
VPHLNCPIPEGLWQALHAHAQRTREPVGHVVRAALSDYLQVSHSTLHQVSTSGALVEGIYQGAVRVGTLREHGDFGLGTFEDLDGEMVLLDGVFYQARSDGSVTQPDDAALSPFALVTHFRADTAAVLDVVNLADLCRRVDELRHTDNFFFALRVDGRFEHVRTRAMCKTHEGVPLVEAAAVQPEFDFQDVNGTAVGFWSPEYSKSVSVPGYHLHFLTANRDGGGHVLKCSGRALRLQLQREGDYRLALPETSDFLKADLHRDPTADLEIAERG